MRSGYALPIDINSEGKFEVGQVVANQKTELLVMKVSLFVFTIHQEILGNNHFPGLACYICSYCVWTVSRRIVRFELRTITYDSEIQGL